MVLQLGYYHIQPLATPAAVAICATYQLAVILKSGSVWGKSSQAVKVLCLVLTWLDDPTEIGVLISFQDDRLLIALAEIAQGQALQLKLFCLVLYIYIAIT